MIPFIFMECTTYAYVQRKAPYVCTHIRMHVRIARKGMQTARSSHTHTMRIFHTRKTGPARDRSGRAVGRTVDKNFFLLLFAVTSIGRSSPYLLFPGLRTCSRSASSCLQPTLLWRLHSIACLPPPFKVDTRGGGFHSLP